MPTIKLVVIGSSGVGKTSLRSQYMSGRFSNGYRATIGADFITKTVPHPHDPAQTVMLQIWDTAGQERFSSLSSAFYRGADAVVLMFDVNAPETMTALIKWWKEFREKAPVVDEDVEDYCCVVVGNKVDLVGTPKGGEEPVTKEQASRFLAELVPLSTTSWDSKYDGGECGDISPVSPRLANRRFVDDEQPSQTIIPATPPSRSHAIAIISNHQSPPRTPLSYSPKHHLSKSRSRSTSRFYAGTVTSTQTSLSIYHTPSSSVFDLYQSARSSPEPWSPSPLQPRIPTEPSSPTALSTHSRSTVGSRSSGSAATITPSLFARENGTGVASSGASVSAETAIATPEEPSSSSSSSAPHLPTKGPKLFFASAKTGQGVKNVFEYIAERVVRRWEYQEQEEARQLHFREASVDVGVPAIRVRGFLGGKEGLGSGWGQCCGS